MPEGQLPVVLPDVERYEPTDTGESPLAAMTDGLTPLVQHAVGLRGVKRIRCQISRLKLVFSGLCNAPRIVRPTILIYLLPSTIFFAIGSLSTFTTVGWNIRLFTFCILDSGTSFCLIEVTSRLPNRMRGVTVTVLCLQRTERKMSKSKGNVVNPDEIVSEKALTLRLYILFMGPFEEPVPWNVNGLVGVRRF